MILQVIDALFFAYMMMLFIRILGSWFPEFQHSTFMRFVAHYTDPYLNIFRQLIPPLGMLDISPFFAFFALMGLEWVVEHILKLVLR